MKAFNCLVTCLIGVITISGCGFFRSKPQRPNHDEPWLTEDEAYEDQMAHTGMDGGALVVPGLQIRDPKDINREEDYTPAKYAIQNGSFETLQSGEVIYVRHADNLMRRSVWVDDVDRLILMDESGCVAHDMYGFDGYYAGPDGSWDKDVPRLQEDTQPVTGKKYVEADDPSGPALKFKTLADGRLLMARRYESFGYSENYYLIPFGRGIYALESYEDPDVRASLAVLPDGKTILFSQAGQTEKYTLHELIRRK